MSKSSKAEKVRQLEPVESGSAARGLPAAGPFEEMERFMERVFPSGWMGRSFRDWPSWSELGTAFAGRMPRVDVIDRDDDVVVRAELPGVDKKDLDVSMTDNTVTIKADTRQEKEEGKKGGDYYRREIATGSFARTVALPAEVDTDKSRARFKDGVLELTVPKQARARRQSIKVD